LGRGRFRDVATRAQRRTRAGATRHNSLRNSTRRADSGLRGFPMHERAADYFRQLQDRICAALERADGLATFREDTWARPGGGGGRTRVIADGAVFEKGGVNFSDVAGELAPEFARQLPGDGPKFSATGVSLVLHPRSPLVPTVHANFRYLTHG